MTRDSERKPSTPPASQVEAGAPAHGMWRETLRITGLFLLGAIGVLVYIVLTSFGAPYWTKLLSIWALSIPFVPVQRRHHLRKTGGDRSRATWTAAIIQVALFGVLMLLALDFMLHSGA